MLTWRHKEARHEGVAVQLKHLTQPFWIIGAAVARQVWKRYVLSIPLFVESCLLYSVRDMLWPCRAGCSPRCRLMSVWVRARRFWFVLGRLRFHWPSASKSHEIPHSYSYFRFEYYISAFVWQHLASEYLLFKYCNDSILWTGWTNCGNGWYLSMLLGVYAGIISKKNMKCAHR